MGAQSGPGRSQYRARWRSAKATLRENQRGLSWWRARGRLADPHLDVHFDPPQRIRVMIRVRARNLAQGDRDLALCAPNEGRAERKSKVALLMACLEPDPLPDDDPQLGIYKAGSPSSILEVYFILFSPSFTILTDSSLSPHTHQHPLTPVSP
jgi:hypothetical protein